ncbi:hypothetical protein KHQ06_23425 [Nocardia tengchongensis]|uniref:Uncharacterized protein n=1 Tax=Nocardia tengchongensis TaxID=2055889 RepID=A0ABX8CHC0_9NOCA|nr:hypothetical protein [Nocardia tengchongensis]QVI19356.1 hypothetical protein KHQ06_23425 [Nocardia tengchongensis]
MTNNHDEIAAVEQAGLIVKEVPLVTDPQNERAAFLYGGESQTAQRISGAYRHR